MLLRAFDIVSFAFGYKYDQQIRLINRASDQINGHGAVVIDCNYILLSNSWPMPAEYYARAQLFTAIDNLTTLKEDPDAWSQCGRCTDAHCDLLVDTLWAARRELLLLTYTLLAGAHLQDLFAQCARWFTIF